MEVAPYGSLVYDPNPDFVGADAFVYVASDDAGAVDAATARIRVRADPRPTDDAYVTPAGVDLVVPRSGVLANDGGGDDASLYVLDHDPPRNGTLLSVPTPDGSFVY